MRVHLDTDIGGDTDDLCALALVLASPDVEVTGITTCADAEGKRRSFTEHALRLAGRRGITVASGSAGFIDGAAHFPTAQDARYWPGLEPIVEPTRPARALELLEASAAAGAHIIAIGPYTNLALLETLRPGSFAHCPVTVMGGYIGPPPPGFPQWSPSIDYNVQADRAAARIVFERLQPLIVTLNVTLATSIRRRDLPALREGGPLPRLLAAQAELHAADHGMSGLAAANPALAEDMLNFQYDSLACAAALGWDCLSTRTERRALESDAEGNFHFVAQTDAPARRFVVEVDAEAFSHRWLATVARL